MARLARPRDGALALGIAAAAALALAAMGREPICTCGTVRLWHGTVLSSENSQHLSDWYTPSHVLHGLVFYLVLRYVAPGWRTGARLVAATLVEATWEALENTDRMIERYREATIALDYYGDSIVNSMADIAFMAIGFAIAARAPVWLSVALFVAAALIVGAVIRDGLLLNLLMLVWPLEAVRAWQSGA